MEIEKSETERNPKKETDPDIKVEPRTFTERPQLHIITTFNDLDIPIETPVLIHDKKYVVIDSSKYDDMRQRADALLNSLTAMNRANTFNYNRYLDLQGKNQALIQCLKLHNIQLPKVYNCKPLDDPIRCSIRNRQLVNVNSSKKEEFLKPTLRKDPKK